MRNVYRVTVDEGAARVNYHAIHTRGNNLFFRWFKSTSRCGKLNVNPTNLFHSRFQNAKKWPPFCYYLQTATLTLTIYHRKDSE